MCKPSQPVKNACSGRCGSDCQKEPLQHWIIAACDGCISVLEVDGKQAKARSDGIAFSSAAAFSDYLAARSEAFDQLIVIGSRNDIAWVSTIIPLELSKCIVAEITYPLVKDWFREAGLKQLTAAITPLLQ